MEENQKSNMPLLCRKGCGFYGSPNFDGLCSKCHRSAQAQQEARESRFPSTDPRKSPDPPVETVLNQDSLACVPENDLPMKVHNPSDPSSAPSISGSHGSSSNLSDCKSSSELDGGGAQGSLSESPADKPDSISNPPARYYNNNSIGFSEKMPRKSRRCEVCRKPVGLASGYTCRCEGLFCSLHRYSDSHNCSFDYRKAGQDDIRRTNPQIVCPKLPKI